MAWNICLVSDNEAIQHLFKRTFADRKDISIKFCATAKEAVQEASTDTLQLLIASATLPDKDGYDLCKELKDDLDVKFPVLLIEDIFEDIDLDRCLEAKTDGFIAKPFEEGLITEKVEEVLHALEKKPLQAEEEDLKEMTPMAEEEAASASMLSSEEEEDIMDLTDLVGEEETATSFDEGPVLEKTAVEEPAGEAFAEEATEEIRHEEEMAAEEEFFREEPEMPPSITSVLEESVSELEKMEAIGAEEAFVFEEGIPEAPHGEETVPEEAIPETAPTAAIATSPEDLEKLVNEKIERAVDEAVRRALDEKLPEVLRKSFAKFLSDFSELLK